MVLDPSPPPDGVDLTGVPAHVACVMDGNGRWASQRGLPRTAGHAAGEEALLDTIEGALDIGVRWLTVFAFSTENWRRPRDEVRYLMGFNESLLVRRRDELHDKGVRIRFAGRRDWRVPAAGAPADGRVDRADRVEPAHDAHDGLQLRRPGRDRRRRPGPGGRGDPGAADRREGHPGATSTSPTSPTPTWWCARRASTGSPTSCSGSWPTPSWSSPTCCGPTSVASTSSTPSPSSNDASGATGGCGDEGRGLGGRRRRRGRARRPGRGRDPRGHRHPRHGGGPGGHDRPGGDHGRAPHRRTSRLWPVARGPTTSPVPVRRASGGSEPAPTGPPDRDAGEPLPRRGGRPADVPPGRGRPDRDPHDPRPGQGAGRGQGGAADPFQVRGPAGAAQPRDDDVLAGPGARHRQPGRGDRRLPGRARGPGPGDQGLHPARGGRPAGPGAPRQRPALRDGGGGAAGPRGAGRAAARPRLPAEGPGPRGVGPHRRRLRVVRGRRATWWPST